MIYILIEFLRSDGSIIINKRLAKVIGIKATVLYSELISRYLYFKDRNMLVEGYFFNTIEDIEDATTLSEYEQTKAIKLLEKLKLISKKTKGLPAKRYFKINEDEKVLINVLKLQQNEQLPKNLETSYQKIW